MSKSVLVSQGVCEPNLQGRCTVRACCHLEEPRLPSCDLGLKDEEQCKPGSISQAHHSFRDDKDSLNYFVNSGDGGYPSTMAECSKEML